LSSTKLLKNYLLDECDEDDDDVDAGVIGEDDVVLEVQGQGHHGKTSGLKINLNISKKVFTILHTPIHLDTHRDTHCDTHPDTHY
jgi:hypothetical protein